MTTIISLIGEQNLPNLLPILHLKPERVILVYTDLTEKTAVRLTKLIQDQVEVTQVQVDAYNIEETKEKLATAVSTSAPSELIVNFTGGTKMMSLAAYQTAADLQAPLLYLQSQGNKSLLYRYEPENGRYTSPTAQTLPSLITIDQYLQAHLDGYQITGINNSSHRGYQFERAVQAALQTAVDETIAGVKRRNTIDIDFVVRCGNIIGIIETKTGLKKPKAGIDQLNTAGGRAYLGTYTKKFFVCDQVWGSNLDDLKQIAADRKIEIIELPSFGHRDALSQADIDKLQAAVRKELGCAP